MPSPFAIIRGFPDWLLPAVLLHDWCLKRHWNQWLHSAFSHTYRLGRNSLLIVLPAGSRRAWGWLLCRSKSRFWRWVPAVFGCSQSIGWVRVGVEPEGRIFVFVWWYRSVLSWVFLDFYVCVCGITCDIPRLCEVILLRLYYKMLVWTNGMMYQICER